MTQSPSDDSRFALVCSSHAPLAKLIGMDADGTSRFSRTLAALGESVRAFRPDVVVLFAPDHFNGFFYDSMPNFCIGAAASGVGDWQTGHEALDVPADCARALVDAVRAEDIDVDFSFGMTVDHGFTQILEMMFGGIAAMPVIPVMINCPAPPRPSLRRVRLLGEAVGRFAATRTERFLFVGSGGLSHDPPIPTLNATDPQQRALVLAGRNLAPEARAAREARVVAAAAAGHGVASLAPDLEWDAEVIDILRSGALEQFDAWRDDEISRRGGSGGHEIRNWIAGVAAFQATGGDLQTLALVYHELVKEWITGMAVIRSSSLNAAFV